MKVQTKYYPKLSGNISVHIFAKSESNKNESCWRVNDVFENGNASDSVVGIIYEYDVKSIALILLNF